MKIAYTSDLHLDFWIDPKLQGAKRERLVKNFADSLFGDMDADLLVIAGDVGHYDDQNIAFLAEAAKRFEHIVLTWGNHDLYLVSRRQRERYKESFARLAAFKAKCEDLEGVKLLDGESVEIDGLRIWGSGMWYEVEDLGMWCSTMSDATKIVTSKSAVAREIDDHGRVKSCYFDPNELYRREMERLGNLEYADVVVSHVPPLLFMADERPEFGEPYYFFNGKDAIERISPKVWIFGHKHSPYDLVYKQTRLVSTPLGYPLASRRIDAAAKLASLEI